MGGEVRKDMDLAAAAAAAEEEEELTWEKLLARVPVRVLLVEGDDSTSQIIAALLRKCGYRATVASDGLRAWEILTGEDHHIDLVLTEVELPKMSGVTLLTMMTAHEKCKDIPVIMMSSKDSISITFKCMIKGAADFLVKPIRKNELTNLWQHVWRRQKCENPPFQKKRKLDVDYDHHSVVNAADKQYYMQNSAKESDVQSSCSRSDMDSERTCTLQNKMELKQTRHRNPSHFDESISPDNHLKKQLDGMPVFTNYEANGLVSLGSDTQPEVVDLIEEINYRPWDASTCENSSDDCTDNHLGDTDLEKKTSSMASLQLSLERHAHIMTGWKENDESNTLHHSNFSAFSLYNNGSSKVVPPLLKAVNFQAKNTRSFSGCTETVDNFHGFISKADDLYLTDAAALSRQKKTTFRCTPVRFVPFPVPVGGVNLNATASDLFLQPAFYQQPTASPWSAVHETFMENFPHESGDFKTAQTHYPEDYSPGDRNFTTHQIGMAEDEERRLVSGETGDGASVCSDSNGRPAAAAGFNISEARARAGDEGGFQTSGPMKSTDAHRLSQREAALIKFRLKRKERCFEKKVRYLSRKKLAEQRPRVKGQFVRHVEPPPLM